MREKERESVGKTTAGEKKAEDTTMPVFSLHQGTTRNDYIEYLMKLVMCLSEITLVDDDKIELRVLKDLDRDSKGNYSGLDYLVFFPVKYEDVDMNLLIQRVDLYFVGIELRGVFYILNENDSFETAPMKSIEKYLEYFHGEKTRRIITVGQSYGALEELAKVKRSQILLGKAPLLEAFEYIATSRGMTKNTSLGKAFLTITQTFCEPLRLRILVLYMNQHFETGFYLPIKGLILQHYWSTSSKILLKGSASPFELYILDEYENKLKYKDLCEEFVILKRFEGSGLKVKDKSQRFDSRVMVTKYLDSCFGDYTNKFVVELGTAYKVRVIVHILHQYVVLQYKYKGFLRKVRVYVEAPDNFEFVEFQPLALVGTKFHAFRRTGIISRATFATTLDAVNDVGEEISLSLDVIEVFPRQYLRGAGTENFQSTWDKSEPCQDPSNIHLGNNLSIKEAKIKATSLLLPLKDVTSQGSRKQIRNCKMTQLHGMFMNTFRVLGEVEYLSAKDKAVVEKIQLSCRYKEKECFEVDEEEYLLKLITMKKCLDIIKNMNEECIYKLFHDLVADIISRKDGVSMDEIKQVCDLVCNMIREGRLEEDSFVVIICDMFEKFECLEAITDLINSVKV